ncbi:MAG: M24 family metallopeptidase [Candidatus Thorarchaeota archaeon]
MNESQLKLDKICAENDFFPMFSDKEMAHRYENVRKEMKDRDLDLIIVHGALGLGNSPGQVNLQYLTRFAALMETFLIVPKEGEPTMFMALNYHIPNALEISYVKDIRSGDCLTNMIQYVKNHGFERGRIGLVGPGAVSYRYFTLFTEQREVLTKNLPNVRFENATQWFNSLMFVKSEEEFDLLKRAGALLDLAQEEVVQFTRPKITHSDLRRVLSIFIARNGATSPFGHVSSFSMKNPSGFYPDSYPTCKYVNIGDMLMSEFTLGFGNYYGKLWSTWFLGNPTPEYEKLFEVAALVHENLIKSLKLGMKGSEIDSFINPIYEAGFEQVPSFLVSGWSIMNHFPFMGTSHDSYYASTARQFDNFEFKPGHTITLHVWVRIPGTRKGLWVGSSGGFTKSGYCNFNRYPVSKLRVTSI